MMIARSVYSERIVRAVAPRSLTSAVELQLELVKNGVEQFARARWKEPVGRLRLDQTRLMNAGCNAGSIAPSSGRTSSRRRSRNRSNGSTALAVLLHQLMSRLPRTSISEIVSFVILDDFHVAKLRKPAEDRSHVGRKMRAYHVSIQASVVANLSSTLGVLFRPAKRERRAPMRSRVDPRQLQEQRAVACGGATTSALWPKAARCG